MAKSKKKVEEVKDQEDQVVNVVVGFVAEPVDPEDNTENSQEIHMNEMQREIAEELALQHVLNDRRAAYPNLLEQIEALWLAHKGDDSEFKRVDAIINEVKAKYPKPEQKTKNEEGE